ncbi:MAG TPA: DMT family transporter [Solirubrobacteraceae bacterium]
MSRTLAIVLAALGGCFVGMQAPINARLGKEISGAQAATVSFLVGTLALIVFATVLSGGLGGIQHAGRAPWWALVGGLLGAFYVTVALRTVGTLGASGLTAIVVTGQLAVSVAVDRFGLFGVARQHIATSRVVGLVLLLAGVVLVVRK